jgi:putative intracellular protease/amidase
MHDAVDQPQGTYDWQVEFGKLPGVKLHGEEQIGMLIYQDFTALDLVGPHHFFSAMAGAKLHLVTNQTDLRPVRSDLGLSITPTATIADCPTDLTLIFIPGGTEGTLAAARDPATVEFVKNRAQRAQFITSVCTGALVLGAAGLLRGKRATTHWSVRHVLPHFGATPVAERVVEDGNLITGAGVTAGMDFGLSLVMKLRGRAYAQAAMLTAEYDPAPPLFGGTPEKTPPEIARPMAALFENFVAEAESLQM